MISGQFIVSALVLSNFVKINGDVNNTVNEFYKQCGEEIAAKNGTVEVRAANLTTHSYSSFSQLKSEITEKPVNYVTPRPEPPLTGDLVRMHVENVAKIVTSTEMEQYYCTFTRIGLLSENGNIIPTSEQSKCSEKCRKLVSNCVTNEEVPDTKTLHEKAYKNVMCIYISNWLLHGFAP